MCCVAALGMAADIPQLRKRSHESFRNADSSVQPDPRGWPVNGKGNAKKILCIRFYNTLIGYFCTKHVI